MDNNDNKPDSMDTSTSRMDSLRKPEERDPSFETASMDPVDDENPIERFHRLVRASEETGSAPSEPDTGETRPSSSNSDIVDEVENLETPAEPSRRTVHDHAPQEAGMSAGSPSLPPQTASSLHDSASGEPDASSEQGDPVDDTAPRRPVRRPFSIEQESLPLRRVPEQDIDATRVSQVTHKPPSSPPPPEKPGSRFRLGNLPGCTGCAIRMGILGLFGLIGIVIVVLSWGLIQYSAIAAELPSVEDLKNRAAKFETTRILDRDGNQLYEILDPTAGRRTYVTLDKISPYMVAAIIATEDSQYYSHPGYDLWAIMRASYQNLSEDTIVSGASTITQQLTRNLLFDPEEAYRRTARFSQQPRSLNNTPRTKFWSCF